MCREKLTATENKLKAAVQDKMNVKMEKAALERELKSLRDQAGRYNKVRIPYSSQWTSSLCIT